MLQDRGSLTNINVTGINSKCYEIIKSKNIEVRPGNVYSTHLPSTKPGCDPLLMPHTWDECQGIMDMIRTKTLSPIVNSWFNVAPTGGSTGPHTHLLVKESVFVFYTQIDHSHPSIEILSNNIWSPVQCTVGDWIQFGGEVMHRVPKNTSTHDRISIMFNI